MSRCKRALRWVGVLAVLAVVGSAITSVTVRQHQPAVLARIKVGMTWREISASLGREPESLVSEDPAHATDRVWWSDDGYIVVRFDDKDKALEAAYHPHPPEPIVDRLCRWLGL